MVFWIFPRNSRLREDTCFEVGPYTWVFEHGRARPHTLSEASAAPQVGHDLTPGISSKVGHDLTPSRKHQLDTTLHLGLQAG